MTNGGPLQEDVLRMIRRLFEEGRFEVTQHFLDEMRDDVLFFVDMETAIREATSLLEDGFDAAGHPKYKLTGPTTDGRAISVVSSLRIEEDILLITVYAMGEP